MLERGKYVISSMCPTPLVIIADPGNDVDDEMALVMLCALWHIGLVDPRGVITNLHPASERAILARGTLDMLGLQHVPVGVGTHGGDLTSPALTLPGYARTPKVGFPSGAELLLRLLDEADDNSLTMLLMSSITDAFEILRTSETLFIQKVNRVVIMGGVEDKLCDGQMWPDTAHNNEFDRDAAEYFYTRVQQLKIPMTVLSRHVAYGCPVGKNIFDILAASGSVIGENLQLRIQLSTDDLWRRAVGELDERKGLPTRCDRYWFIDTFCGGSSEIEAFWLYASIYRDNEMTHKLDKGWCLDSCCRRRSRKVLCEIDDSIWAFVDRFNMYDTFALLACVPCLQVALFSPVKYEVLGIEHLVIGVSNAKNGLIDANVCSELLRLGYLGGSENEWALDLMRDRVIDLIFPK